MVQTVTGEVPSQELGFVLVHEHIFHDLYDVTVNSQLILNDENVARAELAAFKDAGGETLVEQTVYGMNPNPVALRRLAHDVGINIVAGTGFYWERFHPPWLSHMTEDEIVAVFLRDLTDGFPGTGIRAGLLGEIGSGHRAITAAEERVFRAAARAQREVNVPIATHAVFTQIGMEQVRLLDASGANLEKVVIGHTDTVPDVAYQEALLREGVWIAYDCIGQLDKQSDESRADAVMELVSRGWTDRLLLSMDIAKRGALRSYGGGGYDYLITSFIPLLRERGAETALIDRLTRANPQRLFS
jgi:phosphotriesterase-related protein